MHTESFFKEILFNRLTTIEAKTEIMKIFTVLTGLLSAGLVSAFTDTGRIYIDERLGEIKLDKQLYKADEINQYLVNGLKSGDKVAKLYRLSQDLLGTTDSNNFDSTNVYYKSVENINFEYEDLNVAYYDQLSEVKDLDLAVFDLEDRTYSIEELTSQDDLVIIQVIPSFEKETVEVEAEASQAFVSSKKDKQTQTSLFTEYQFFTPGIWSCILISLFLLGILYTALVWVGSIEITYNAFDKQVDFEKKNE